MKNIVIWGAGILGRRAISKYKNENIICIIDNDKNKQGNIFEGYIIQSFEWFLKQKNEACIIICMDWRYVYQVVEQLRSHNISSYRVYIEQLFENVDLIYNQYEEFEGGSEDEWNKNKKLFDSVANVRDWVDKRHDCRILFHEIEIETINRCNGNCSFCPVNKKIDPRHYKIMDDRLFKKIISELKELSYSGRVALFSNNEPMLDSRIIQFSKYTRENLPYAHIHMFTNGTLLSLAQFQELIKYLDELIIDNYNQDLHLLPNVKEIIEYIESPIGEKYRKKLKVLLRKPNEILTSRGGDAPNRKHIIDFGKETCALPFQQMVIRPSGKVSLCCNDPYGKCSLGDVCEQKIIDIWYGKKYRDLRENIYNGRRNVEHCQRCDTFMLI